MRKILLFLVFSLAAGAAQAQIKCWNEGGKRVCGDAPPAGAKTTTIKTDSSGGMSQPAPAAATKDGADPAAKSEKKGPMTPADREADYKMRQAEAQKAAEKAAAAEKDAAAKRENCDRAKAALRQYEGGQRVARTNAQGERYFLDESQVAQETAKARQAAQDSCN